MSNHLPFIITISFAITLLFFFYIRKFIISIKRREEAIDNVITFYDTKFKYYDIMLAKEQIKNESHPSYVWEEDLVLFTEEERKFLTQYYKDLETIKVYIKGLK